jgi:hypothetical protein
VLDGVQSSVSALGEDEYAIRTAIPKILRTPGSALSAALRLRVVAANAGSTKISKHAKFCGGCGSALTEPAASQTSGSSTANVGADAVAPNRCGGHESERRHLTVLFCDLVGSMAIATQLDPEEWRKTVAGHERAAAGAVTRLDGHVAKISRRWCHGLLRLARGVTSDDALAEIADF